METTKRAADLVAEIFPAIKPRDRVKLLFNCTGHPCAGIDVVEKQLRSLAEKANGTYEGCIEASRRESEAMFNKIFLPHTDVSARNTCCLANLEGGDVK